MYQKHFGFHATPFSISPDPHYLYMSEQHREALAHLCYALHSDGGVVLLTGEVGTGKTTVCRCFLEQLPQSCDLAFIVHPKLTVEELLATVCDEFGIKYVPQQGVKHLVDHLHQFLLSAYRNHRHPVLLIDEAQNLSADVLEQLRLLTNLETNQKKLLQIILLGQPELQEMLNQEKLRQLSQRVIARYHLKALSKHEMNAYVCHRLKVSGVMHPIFSSRSLTMVYQQSRGIPRMINLFCDRALLGAYAQHRLTVSGKVMAKAIREVLGEKVPIHHAASRRVVLWFILLMSCVALWYSLYVFSSQVVSLSVVTPKPNIEYVPLEHRVALVSHRVSNERNAIQSLLKVWGVQKKYKDPICQSMLNDGLHCMEKKGSWQRIKKFNRPVILHLFDEKKRPFDVTLVTLDQKNATVILDGKIHIVPLHQLDAQWYGDYLLLWRSLKYIQPSAKHEKLLRIIERMREHPQEEDIQAIQQFQLEQGLESDGVIGQKTMNHLYMAMDTDAPKLMQESK